MGIEEASYTTNEFQMSVMLVGDTLTNKHKEGCPKVAGLVLFKKELPRAILLQEHGLPRLEDWLAHLDRG